MARTSAPGLLACTVPLLLAAQQSETAVAARFRANVDLAQVDAVVTDAKGHPVHDLEAADFLLFEDGRPQVITNFSYEAVTPLPTAKQQHLSADEVRRVAVLMFDDSGTESYQLAPAVEAGKKFVDTELAPGDLASVMVSRGGMGFYEQLTSDKRQLHAAIDRIGHRRGWLVCDQPLPPMPGAAGLGAAQKAMLEAPPIHACDPPNPVGNLYWAVQGLSTLPGRKAIILFTHSFPAPPALIQAANKAGVAIYVIDPTDVLKRGIVASNAAYRKLAADTGGIFLLSGGGPSSISKTMSQALQDLSGYYLLGYHRQRADSGPAEHRVTVTVKRKGYQVRTRSRPMDAATGLTRTAPKTKEEFLKAALFSPFSAGRMRLRLQPLYGASPPDSRTLKRSTVLRAKLAIEGEDVRLTEAANGEKQLTLDTLIAVFDEAGNPVATSGKTFTMQGTPQKFAALLESPLQFQMDVTVPKPGAYQVRTAVRDETTGETGSAYEFVRLPDFNRQGMMLTSIMLVPDSAAGEFEPGADIGFLCEVLGARTDRAGGLKIDVEVRLRRGETAVVDEQPQPAEIRSTGGRRFLVGKIHIPDGATSGDYALEVIAYDRLMDAKRQTVSQWAGLTVRQGH